MPSLLLTGANRGLGLALARRYAGRGWRVHACCRDPDRAHALRALAGAVRLHRLELRDPSHHAALLDALGEEPLDVVIANAAVPGPPDSPADLDVGAWLETFHVNVIAPARLALALRPHLARSRLRRLVAITSLLGSIADNRTDGLLAYRSSKAALHMVWRSLAVAFAADGIICTLIHPGWVRTRMGGPAAPLSPEDSAAHIQDLIDRLGPEHNGAFLSWRGEPCPW